MYHSQQKENSECTSSHIQLALCPVRIVSADFNSVRCSCCNTEGLQSVERLLKGYSEQPLPSHIYFFVCYEMLIVATTFVCVLPSRPSLVYILPEKRS